MSIFSNKKVITAIGVGVVATVGLVALGIKSLSDQIEEAFAEIELEEDEEDGGVDEIATELTVDDIVKVEKLRNPSATQI